ncbi:MAG: hypothetical protein OP8BY_1784 [Candidatus Saccharicenans subterraneus]|uniref:Uncharacterized protein n=1 Tax=Candidatus Saccharicenans subterraneus TaxID=2508984 RepID=A0A3E2BN47_9BACT|nr:MAG: hypothetical protein OP8BY_1784 [Candidatus Saccharicenans subterraneum]
MNKSRAASHHLFAFIVTSVQMAIILFKAGRFKLMKRLGQLPRCWIMVAPGTECF